MKTAFIYSDNFSRINYGAEHPLKPLRLKLTYELIRACGLIVPGDPRLIEPEPASEEDLLAFHTPDYLGILKAANTGRMFAGARLFGLGPGDNPVFPGLLDWSRLVTGASLLAAGLVDNGRVDIAFNIGGGLHHALPSQASGFCYINDPVIAIQWLVNRGRRVAYIDIDAHHGDGVQAAFYATDRVLTISLHETGAALFPGTGFPAESGTANGKGYSVNIPLPPETDDELFLHAFTRVVPPLIGEFRPDVVVSQLGVDTLRTDPLTHLNYTTQGFCKAVRLIKDLCPKWVALGGGGYDIGNVARAWTLAWAIMNDADLPEEIPEAFLSTYPEAGFTGGNMQDQEFTLDGRRKEMMKKEVDRAIAAVREQLPGRPEASPSPTAEHRNRPY